MEARHEMTVLPVAREEHVADDRAAIEAGMHPFLSSKTIRTTHGSCWAWRADSGFKGIVAAKGAHALMLAKQYRPAAISLDIFLPDMLGWTVLNQLKLDPATRHIPVQIVTLDEERQHGLARGAFAYLVKEATTDRLEAAFERSRVRELGLQAAAGVEDNAIERASIVELLDHDDIETVVRGHRPGSADAMLERPFDCVVPGPSLPDMTGFELLERIHGETGARGCSGGSSSPARIWPTKRWRN
jgi:CheY-like chemotaxis protein